MTFTVYVDDNYCYMDEDRRWKLGEFETHQEAVAAVVSRVRHVPHQFIIPNSIAVYAPPRVNPDHHMG